ncbi:ral guanine nucleotide dissociation stimulator-like [Orcinus orca]|nr:ral guanine nucleotide dissociation stimulator-like [Orcinus orca]
MARDPGAGSSARSGAWRRAPAGVHAGGPAAERAGRRGTGRYEQTEGRRPPCCSPKPHTLAEDTSAGTGHRGPASRSPPLASRPRPRPDLSGAGPRAQSAGRAEPRGPPPPPTPPRAGPAPRPRRPGSRGPAGRPRRCEPPMVQRMWAEAAGPAGGAEPLFPGSRRSRSVWDAVRLEVGGPDSCPVVLHSFTQLDPDLPRLESSTQEIGEELVNGVIYSISLRKVQVHHGANKGQRWLGYENDSALNLYETCKVRTVKAGTLEKLVEHLVPAFQESDLSYVTIFLCTYRAFTTTQRVLDLLFQRYGCILPYSSEDGGPQDQLKNAVSSILGTWLDQYSEDFCQPPDFPCLKQLVAYVQLNMPGSDLERRAHLLLAQLERTELTKAEQEGEERGRCWTRRSPWGCLRPPTWGPLAGRRPVSDPGWSLCKRPRAVSFACKGPCEAGTWISSCTFTAISGSRTGSSTSPCAI